MDFRDYLRIFRRQLVLIVAATLIGASAGALVALLTPQRYHARAEVMVTVNVSDTATPGERALATGYAQQVVETYRSVITSSLVLDPVIDDLRLKTTTTQLSSAVRASTSPGSTLLTITVDHTNPGQAARIANAVVSSFSTAVSDTLEKRAKETSYSVRIVTLQPAQVPTSPAAPNFPLYLLVGTLLGLAAGLGIALLRSALDQRVRTGDDVIAAVDAPLLASIPIDEHAHRTPLVVTAHPQSPAAESFRTLRTNARFLFRDGQGVFVITSSGPGEGKSTTASNLAITFADAGLRVALVDGDLRLPRISAHFGIEGGIGLSDVLAGRVSITDVIQRWAGGTLFIIPAGAVPPNPAELLGSAAMASMIDALKAAFDVIIIDAPPLLLVTDAAVMSRHATGALLIAASGISRANSLADAAKSIAAADGRVLGTVLTMTRMTAAEKSAYGAPATASVS